jgi:hypothetical protein
LRHEEFDGLVALGRKKGHFICESNFLFFIYSFRGWVRLNVDGFFFFKSVVTIESTGCIPVERILPESVTVFLRKVRDVRKSLDWLENKML